MYWTDKEDKILISMYPTSRIDDIVIELGKKRNSIYNRAFNLGLKRNVYGNNVLVDFFDIWSEEMAYILGFIAADGCVHDNGKGRKVLVIKLSYKDIDHLKKLRDLIYPNGNIRIFDEKIGKQRYKQCSLCVGSKHLYKKLNELGIAPRKSLTLKFPDIPEQYIKHFVRGYFDGDGSIYYLKKENRWRTSFCGTEEFLNKLMILLNNKIGISKPTIEKRKDNRICQIKYSKYDSYKLCKWMYDGCNIKLQRKYNKYLDLVSQIGG